MKKMLLVCLCAFLLATLPGAALMHAPTAPAPGHHWVKLPASAPSLCQAGPASAAANSLASQRFLDPAFTLHSARLDGQWWSNHAPLNQLALATCTCTDSTCICARCCLPGKTICPVICG